MIIANQNFPSIGHIRCKPLPNGEDWRLQIYAPDGGPIMGHEPATIVEVIVPYDELERIERVAPHLMPGVFERQCRNDRAHG